MCKVGEKKRDSEGRRRQSRGGLVHQNHMVKEERKKEEGFNRGAVF